MIVCASGSRYTQEHLETGRTGGSAVREYAVIYEPAGGNCSAYVPDLPGCIACGDTLEETEVLMKEAVELYIEALREIGKPVPEPTTKARASAVAG
jgi:predicted RNase H-like HicB family nuclease